MNSIIFSMKRANSLFFQISFLGCIILITSCQPTSKKVLPEDIEAQKIKEKIILDSLLKKYPNNYFELNDYGLLTYLTLRTTNLTNIPDEIKFFKKLKGLSIKNAQIKSLPNWLPELRSLEKIILSYNQFEKVPPVLNQCKNLKSINFRGNLIKYFELDSIMPNLEWLDLIECPLKEFPIIKQNEDAPPLHLDLRNTPLKSIPKEIGNMKIYRLWMENNQLEYIAPEIGMLKDLKELDLSGSPKLNAQFPETIGKCTNLEDLKLNWCGLQEFPAFIGNLENLVYLHLENNLLKEIPSEIGNLKKLEYFRMKENKLSTLPKELNQLPRLQYLGLEYNNISEFPTEMFDIKRDTLCVLVLDGNPVRGIPVSEEQFHKGYKHFGEKQ